MKITIKDCQTGSLFCFWGIYKKNINVNIQVIFQKKQYVDR